MRAFSGVLFRWLGRVLGHDRVLLARQSKDTASRPEAGPAAAHGLAGGGTAGCGGGAGDVVGTPHPGGAARPITGRPAHSDAEARLGHAAASVSPAGADQDRRVGQRGASGRGQHDQTSSAALPSPGTDRPGGPPCRPHDPAGRPGLPSAVEAMRRDRRNSERLLADDRLRALADWVAPRRPRRLPGRTDAVESDAVQTVRQAAPRRAHH